MCCSLHPSCACTTTFLSLLSGCKKERCQRPANLCSAGSLQDIQHTMGARPLSPYLGPLRGGYRHMSSKVVIKVLATACSRKVSWQAQLRLLGNSCAMPTLWGGRHDVAWPAQRCSPPAQSQVYGCCLTTAVERGKSSMWVLGTDSQDSSGAGSMVPTPSLLPTQQLPQHEGHVKQGSTFPCCAFTQVLSLVAQTQSTAS